MLTNILKKKTDNDGVEYYDHDLTLKQCYLGNQRIKKADVVADFTPEQMSEYYKCSKDPIYFIEKYIKVVHIDHGLMGMKLYPYQKDVVKLVTENNFSLILQCRQSGKCCNKTTNINIRNKKTGIVETIEIEEFYKRVDN